MNPKEIAITAFDYPLAQEDIAQYPLAERDHSKLLVYKEHKHRSLIEIRTAFQWLPYDYQS